MNSNIKKMRLVDTHAHLADFYQQGTLEEVLRNAEAAGIERIITCSTNTQDWLLYQKLCVKYPQLISWQIGIHPSEVKENDETALESMGSFFVDKAPPVAIGEIGLDYYRLPQDSSESSAIINLQQRIFKKQLLLAKDFDCPICIHARSAERDAIDIMKEVGVDFTKVVFHCFSGDEKEQKEINTLGARSSFTGIITYPNAEQMRKNMLSQGLEKLMLETDCPYLSPIPLRGKINTPANVAITARYAANLFEIPLEELSEITTQNALKFFLVSGRGSFSIRQTKSPRLPMII